jgi:hypothetical protein
MSCEKCLLDIIRKCQAVLQMVKPFGICTCWGNIPAALHPCQHLMFSHWNFIPDSRMCVMAPRGLNVLSLITNGAKRPFSVPIYHL